MHKILFGTMVILMTCVVCSKDTEPPLVLITSPSDGDTIRVYVCALSADASDNDEITYVEFHVDNDVVGVDSNAPYTGEWTIGSYENLSPHSIHATAEDQAGNISQSDECLVTVITRGTVEGLSTDSSYIIDLSWTTVPLSISGVPEHAVVDSAKAILTIYHQNPSDMDIYLRAPDSTQVLLWDNAFAGPVDSTVTTGLAGKDVNGTWLLRIYDEVANGLAGAITESRVVIYWSFE